MILHFSSQQSPSQKFKYGPSKVYDWALLGPSLIIYCKPWIYPWNIIALSLYR